MMIGISIGLGPHRYSGPLMYMYFGSVLHELLEGEDGMALMGDDGFYLYGVV